MEDTDYGDTWEYKTLATDAEALPGLLAELGGHGWELVAMVAVPVKHEKAESETVTVWESTAYRLVFKRRGQV